MARDKDFEMRMQGMIYAFNIAKKEGIEALEKEIKRRNVLRAPMKFTAKQIEDFWGELSKNIYTNMITTVCYVLHDQYEFGPELIQEFKKKFDYAVESTLDLDYLGEHYIKLEDYAAELNEKFNLGIDVSRVSMCQSSYDKTSDDFHTCRVEKIIELLMDNGHFSAAEFLKSRIEE